MTSRILPPEEYGRLMGTEAEHFHPEGAQVLVVEQDGAIVACTVFFQAWHADCIWMHPAYRHGGLARALWRAVVACGTSLGIHAVLIAVTLPVMRRFFCKVGATRVPGEQFVWVLKPQR